MIATDTFSSSCARALCIMHMFIMLPWLLGVPASAEEGYIQIHATIELQFQTNTIPKTVTLAAQQTKTISDDAEMKKEQTIEFRFDPDNLKEALLSVTANWDDDHRTTYNFSLLPSQLKDKLPIPISGKPESDLPVQFVDGLLTDLSKQYCNSLGAEKAQRLHAYIVCRFIFMAYNGSENRHFKAALRSMKGAFDNYWNLVAKDDYGVARDEELEAEVRRYAADATLQTAIKNTFREMNVSVRYFDGMLVELATASTNRFKILRREIGSYRADSAKAKQALIENELLKQRFEIEVGKVNQITGKKPVELNGLTVKHFDDFDGLVRNMLQ